MPPLSLAVRRRLVPAVVALAATPLGCAPEAVPPAGVPPVIVVDGRFQDWPADGGDPLQVALGSEYLFIRFRLESTQLLQEEGDTVLWIDADDDPATGCRADGDAAAAGPAVPPGAEMAFRFSAGRGVACRDGSSLEVTPADLGLVSAPTIAAAEFELALDRRAGVNPWLLAGPRVRVGLDPGAGVVVDLASAATVVGPSVLETDRPDGTLRAVAYNVRRDGLLDADAQRRAALERIVRALDADLWGLQEVYEGSAGQLRQRLVEIDGGPWHAAKEGQDLVLLSRFPIRRSRLIRSFDDFGAAAAFQLEASPAGGSGFTVLLAHWPCCNDEEPPSERRRRVLARAMADFLEEAASGNGDWELETGTPVLVMGDLNLVASSLPLDILTAVAAPGNGTGWLRLRPVDPRHVAAPLVYTWRRDGDRYGPGRLDFILASGEIGVERAFVFATETLPAQVLERTGVLPADAGIASDHLPVVVDVRVETGVAPAS